MTDEEKAAIEWLKQLRIRYVRDGNVHDTSDQIRHCDTLLRLISNQQNQINGFKEYNAFRGVK